MHDGALDSVIVLGAVHGINPAMGWLFAVSLGLQAQSGRAVWRALGPLALGHALAIAAALLTAAALGVVLPLVVVRWTAAVALLAFGIFHLISHRHPASSRGGMTIGMKDLTIWSFIVSSAHGAGLMILPFVLGASMPGTGVGAGHSHAEHLGGTGLLAMALHTASYLTMAGLIAWVVYSKLGLRLLRTAWVNVNVVWAAALIVTGVVSLLL
jgi:hypothetical protein